MKFAHNFRLECRHQIEGDFLFNAEKKKNEIFSHILNLLTASKSTQKFHLIALMEFPFNFISFSFSFFFFISNEFECRSIKNNEITKMRRLKSITWTSYRGCRATVQNALAQMLAMASNESY